MSVYCPTCGGRNDDSLLVCRVCGKPLNRERSPVGFVLAIGIVVVLVIALVDFPYLKPYGYMIKSDLLAMLQNGTDSSSNVTLSTQNASVNTTATTSVTTTSSTSTTTVQVTSEITAVNLMIIRYNNLTGNYTYYTQTYGGLSVMANSTFPYTIQISNAGNYTYMVDYANVSTSGFALISTSPSLPYALTPQSSLGITMFMHSANTPYTGTLALNIFETGHPPSNTVSNTMPTTIVSTTTIVSNTVAANSMGSTNGTKNATV